MNLLKSVLKKNWRLLGVIGFACLMSGLALADEPAPSPIISSIGAWLQPILLDLVQKYPVASAIGMVIAVARACMKPAFSIARAIVDATPNPNDNLILDKVEAHPAKKFAFWLLDYLFSIKVAAGK